MSDQPLADFVENDEGVHFQISEFTLCGDAFDAPETEADWPDGPFRKTSKRIVTCPRCASIIRKVRQLQVRP